MISISHANISIVTQGLYGGSTEIHPTLLTSCYSPIFNTWLSLCGPINMLQILPSHLHSNWKKKGKEEEKVIPFLLSGGTEAYIHFSSHPID